VRKPAPKTSLDRLRAKYSAAIKNDESAKRRLATAKRAYDEARGNRKTYKVDLERLGKNYERARKDAYTAGRELVSAKRAYEYARKKQSEAKKR
jgi:hypothetical protein